LIKIDIRLYRTHTTMISLVPDIVPR